MAERGRRGGIFERIPRAYFRRTGVRYFDACALAIVANGVTVAGWGLVTLVIYVDLSFGELALYTACSVAGYVVEGVVAGQFLRSRARPVRAWLAGEREEAAARVAWTTAAGLPLALLRHWPLYVIGAAGTIGASLVLASQLDLPALHAALLLPVSYLLYLYSALLRYLALELGMRPVLEAIGGRLSGMSPAGLPRVSVHRRLLATVPMVTWGSGILVAGLVTANTRDLDTIGLAGVVAVAVTTGISTWLSFVLADAVSGPIVDLRDATRRVGAGDLGARVPVVSMDETGELAASFNEMVAGLEERDQLRDAFGAFVDPALIERVLAEGTDLAGEDVEVSVLFVDVRGFTALTERAGAHEVVATLNTLYEAIVPVIARHGGHANKFIGDGLLAVFGAPVRHRDHARRAVAAARELAALVRDDLPGHVSVGVGVNSGRVVVGTIGGGGRRDFTVIGDTVNTAARVEAATRVTGDEILITEATLRALGSEVAGFEERTSAPLKGKRETVRLFAPRDP